MKSDICFLQFSATFLPKRDMIFNTSWFNEFLTVFTDYLWLLGNAYQFVRMWPGSHLYSPVYILSTCARLSRPSSDVKTKTALPRKNCNSSQFLNQGTVTLNTPKKGGGGLKLTSQCTLKMTHLSGQTFNFNLLRFAK